MFDSRKYDQEQPQPPTIERLYPDFTAEERAEAEDTVRRYVQLVWRMFKRMKSEKNGKI